MLDNLIPTKHYGSVFRAHILQCLTLGLLELGVLNINQIFKELFLSLTKMLKYYNDFFIFFNFWTIFNDTSQSIYFVFSLH